MQISVDSFQREKRQTGAFYFNMSKYFHYIYGSQAYFISDASTIRTNRKHMKVPLYKGLKWMELLLPIQLLPNSTKFGAGTSFGGSGGGGGGPARLAGGSGGAGSSGA